MSNPFQYIRDEREAKACQEAEQRELRSKAIARAHAEYGPMVEKVLSQLRDAAYPDKQVRWTAYDYRRRDYWSIGSMSHDYEDGDNWGAWVLVSVEFSDHHEPLGFLCAGGERGNPELQCGLTESELVATLQQLHPSQNA